MDFDVKVLKDGLKTLNIAEGFRYPLFAIWIAVISLVGVIFIADFLLSKKNIPAFQGLVDLKDSIFTSKWKSIVVASLTIVASILLLFFPAGVLNGFFGDLLPALGGLFAGVAVLIASFFGESRISSLFTTYSKFIGFGLLVLVLLHILMPTVPLL